MNGARARRRCDQLNDCHRIALKTKHPAVSIQANGLPRVFALLGHDTGNEMAICPRWHRHFDGDSFQSHGVNLAMRTHRIEKIVVAATDRCLDQALISCEAVI